MPNQEAEQKQQQDPELERITSDEESCLKRVLEHLSQREAQKPQRTHADYDVRLLDLRDQIASARMEDVPPLLEEMERLQSLAARRREITEVHVDARSPYFGHLELEEGDRRREVLIGRGTYLDTKSGIRIVDWRDAPVSRLYYRYDEGEEYDEIFGDREVSGNVVTRRSVTIADSVLRRITAPQGSFVRRTDGTFRRLESQATRLTGGAGTATRASQHHRPGRLGVGQEGADDKHLKEITPLIDRRQFELITKPNSGLVVIQGGAGSGKTTIGLHRLAYLAFNDPRRFRPDRMLIVVFNDALARYISQVLPALGVGGLPIRTYENWAQKLRQSLFSKLPDDYRDDTPSVVTRFKKHPAMLRAIDTYVAELVTRIETELRSALQSAGEIADVVMKVWDASATRPLVHRLHGLLVFVEGDRSKELRVDPRVALERVVRSSLREARDVVGAWSDMLSDRSAIGRYFAAAAPGAFREGELDRVHGWCAARCAEVVQEVEARAEQREARAEQRGEKRRDRGAKPDAEEDADAGERLPSKGVDGLDVTERAKLDLEDDTLILRFSQRLRGPLTKGATNKEAILYEHVLIDEAQDMSPVELAVVLDTVSKARSITLAGDVQQRLLMDNGFTDWNTVLGELGLAHVEVEPLKLSYRSTQEIIDFARAVLGPLASSESGMAVRHGAPVELFQFAHSGDTIGFLGEALRELMQTEPTASVAVVTRYPEQADLYYDGLRRAEVPYLRRIAEQDFPFKPGIDVTDVRQVKGLEFDYVIVVEASDSSYPTDEEARHLMHIAATRAAHQLWVLTTGKPSPLIPEELRQQSY